MKRWIFCAALATLAWAVTGPAWARGGVRAEVVIGPIVPWAYYPAPVFYPPIYYPPTYVVVPAAPREAPPVYIQQQQPAPAAPSAATPSATAPQNYYFCPDSKTYYPYVKTCASGWQAVAPRPEGVAPQ